MAPRFSRESRFPGATFNLRVRAIGAAGMGPPGQAIMLVTR